MKLQFKHQKFQADAAAAVCDVFAGQPDIKRHSYIHDIGKTVQNDQLELEEARIANIKHVSVTGFGNAPVIKGMDGQKLRKVEELKIHCAREHFRRISSNEVKYEVVDNYHTLLNTVMK